MSLLSFFQPSAPTQVTSTTTSDVKTVAVPAAAKGLFINCATTDCRITVDGTTVSSTVGLQIKAANNPVFLPVRPSSTGVQVVSTAAANSVIDIMFVS